MRALLLGLTLALATPLQPAAQAAVPTLSHWDAGMAAFSRGDYEAALKAFQQARFTKGDRRANFMVGRCLEQLGRKAEAIEVYQQLLFVESLDPGLRGQVEHHLKKLGGQPAKTSSAPVATPGGTGTTPKAPAPAGSPVVPMADPDAPTTADPTPTPQTTGATHDPVVDKAETYRPVAGIVLPQFVIPLRFDYDGSSPVGPGIEVGFQVAANDYTAFEMSIGYLGFELGGNVDYAWLDYLPLNLGFRFYTAGIENVRHPQQRAGAGLTGVFGFGVGGAWYSRRDGASQHRDHAQVAPLVVDSTQESASRLSWHAILTAGFELSLGKGLALRLEARTWWLTGVFIADLNWNDLFKDPAPSWLQSFTVGLTF